MPTRDVVMDFELFAHEGENAFGAVREIHRDHLIGWIENHGEMRIDAAHIASVHDGKVVLHDEGLPEALSVAIAHAHDAESGRSSAGASRSDRELDDAVAYRDEEE